MKVVFALLVLVAVTTSALYTPSDDVVELTASNFQSEVINSEHLWLVEFYAPWCGHCKNLAPEWKKVATALKGFVKVGAVDMDQHSSVGSPYSVTGFPTIKFFGLDKKSPDAYNGGRTAKEIADFAMKEAQSAVSVRLGGKKKSDKPKSGGSGKDAVIELTSENFQKEVLDSSDVWMVEFFAPWCGHCKNLAPEWKAAAEKLVGKVKLGAVDATIHGDLAQKYDVKGYPTIKVFTSDKSSPIDYDGGRTSGAIVSYANKLADENSTPPEVVQLTGQDVMDSVCAKSSLCVIAFLPHILDSQAAGRNEYLAVLDKLANKFKSKPLAYVWVEGFQQPKLESSLGVGGSGYPALTVVNVKKKRAASLTTAFTVDHIETFISQLFSGKQKTLPFLADLAELDTFPKWDGKDAEVPKEESYEYEKTEL